MEKVKETVRNPLSGKEIIVGGTVYRDLVAQGVLNEVRVPKRSGKVPLFKVAKSAKPSTERKEIKSKVKTPTLPDIHRGETIEEPSLPKFANERKATKAAARAVAQIQNKLKVDDDPDIQDFKKRFERLVARYTPQDVSSDEEGEDGSDEESDV